MHEQQQKGRKTDVSSNYQTQTIASNIQIIAIISDLRYAVFADLLTSSEDW